MKNKPTALGILLGSNVAKRRKELGLTQAEFAQKIGADIVTISRFETGSSLPSLLRLEAIAQALGLPLAELLSESTNLCTDQSLLIQGWIAGLSEADRKFMLDMVQAWSVRLKT
ncbi:MAG: helix-turn-helix transcriptional regulator [Gallionellaceae bacterium]|nr:helix-turn-helix transcriptional regulator [Gallionellaceae bacterium]